LILTINNNKSRIQQLRFPAPFGSLSLFRYMVVDRSGLSIYSPSSSVQHREQLPDMLLITFFETTVEKILGSEPVLLGSC